jgi:hypothetical protein
VVVISLILAALALLASAFCIYWLWRLRKRFTSAFASLDSKQDLASTITDYFKKTGATKSKLDNLEKGYGHLSEIGARSFQKSAIVRFNPFRNTGGDQSFVLALLDNNDSGMLLTSIHGREGTRVYIKPIAYGNSDHTLSAEESQALKDARRAGSTELVDG